MDFKALALGFLRKQLWVVAFHLKGQRMYNCNLCKVTILRESPGRGGPICLSPGLVWNEFWWHGAFSGRRFKRDWGHDLKLLVAKLEFGQVS